MTAAVATGAAESCCASCAKNLPCETGCARHDEKHVGEDFPTPQDAIQSAVSKGFTHADIGPDQQGHVYRQNPDGSTRVSRLYFNKGKYHFDYPHDVSQPIPASARPLVERRIAAEEAGRPVGLRGWHRNALGVIDEDPRHAHVYRLVHGQVLLGDVRDSWRARSGELMLRVTHFNGDPWPDGGIVRADDVYVIDREPQAGAREQRGSDADQLQWFDAGNFYFARVPGGDYTISKVPGVHHLAWQPHGGRAVALGSFASPEMAQVEAVHHYHTMCAAPVYQAAEARAGYKPAGAVRPGDRLRDEDGTGARVLDVRGAPHGRVQVTVERANGRQVTWNAAPEDQLQLAEAEMKLGIEPAADDYLAVDATGKTVGGPFKSLSDAKSLAQQHGGYVKFVMEAGEATPGGDRFTKGERVALTYRGAEYEGEVVRHKRDGFVTVAITVHGEPVWVDYEPQYLRRLGGAAGEQVQRASVCRPWMRPPEKDLPAFNACMDLAEKIGPINGHDSLHSFIRGHMERQDQECFVVVLLDTQMQIRYYTEVARGARDRVPTPVADVARVVVAESLQLAVYYGAMGVAVSHNHPSGKPQPSDADAQVTDAMQRACETLGVLFVDHIVVGRHSYYSFKKQKTFRPRSPTSPTP